MSAIQPSPGEPSASIDYTQKLDTFTKRLRQAIVTAMKAILIDHERRQSGFKEDISCLEGGIWKAWEYAEALQKAKQKQRRAWFKKHHHFHSGYAPPKYFTRVGPYTFQIKKKVNPSEAIKEVKRGLFILTSTGVCQLALFSGLLHVWGEQRFNKVFDAMPEKFRISHYNDQCNLLLLFLCQPYHFSGTPSTLEVGQKIAFRNHPSYPDKHIDIGPTTMINTIYLGKDQFGVFGLSKKGISRDQSEQFLVDEYNLDPKEPHELYSAALIKQMAAVDPVDFPDKIDRAALLEAGGGMKAVEAIDFNFPLVKAIRDLSLREISVEKLTSLKKKYYQQTDMTRVTPKEH